MPFPKKPYKPKRRPSSATTAMFPSLHSAILAAVADTPISPPPWFNHTSSDHEPMEEYATHIMGRFDCRNGNCSRTGWGSKKISILIRRFSGNGYNAVVFKQRCKSCERLGVLRMDENSYVERVAYRLKKWAGVEMEPPPYQGEIAGAPHEARLCEGCRRGVCQWGMGE